MERSDILDMTQTTGKVAYTFYTMHRYRIGIQMVYPQWEQLPQQDREAWCQAEIGVILGYKLRRAVLHHENQP